MAREQLATYPSVEVRDTRVASIEGERGAFRIGVGGNTIEARRVILCTGMIDEMLPIDGFEKHWGHAIFQCPYCHGWEVRDKRWGHLARVRGRAAVHRAPHQLDGARHALHERRIRHPP